MGNRWLLLLICFPGAQLIRGIRHKEIWSSEEADLKLEVDNDLCRLNVESKALSVDAILEEVCQGRPFKAAILGAWDNVSKVVDFLEAEIKRVLDVEVVDWESLRKLFYKV